MKKKTLISKLERAKAETRKEAFREKKTNYAKSTSKKGVA